jgi:hypothetical protein
MRTAHRDGSPYLLRAPCPQEVGRGVPAEPQGKGQTRARTAHRDGSPYLLRTPCPQEVGRGVPPSRRAKQNAQRSTFNS